MNPNESTLELALLDWLRELGWVAVNGPEIEPEKPGAEGHGVGHGVLNLVLPVIPVKISTCRVHCVLNTRVRSRTGPLARWPVGGR